jgi:CDP-4-dehydro-6-deoxyglucose reductase
MLKARLIDFRQLSPDVRHFDFEVPGVDEFKFEPGQFVSIVKTVETKPITRAYSIASARDGNRFSLCLNLVHNGLISSYLFGLQRGDEIEIQEPLGYFIMRHPGHHSLFIATGTGIAPFRSMLMEHLPKTQPKVTLLFGVRHEYGLLYRSELEQLASAYPSFRFVPTITRPTDTWRGKTGRVQSHLDELLQTDDIATRDVYICGLKEMVDDVRRQLKERGFDRKQVFYERYD